MGDSILTTPLIKAVKAELPDSLITFCVRPENAELFENVHFIDEVITFDKRGADRGFGGAVRFAEKLRSKNFDLVFSPHMSFRTSAVLFISGIPERIGFVESALSAVYTMSCAKDLTYHEAERYLLLFERYFHKFPGEVVTPEVCQNSDLTAKYKSELGENLIGINPGSMWNTKKWPAEYYAEVADKLKENNYTPVIIGGELDRKDAEKLIEYAKYDHINYAGKTSLKELPALISAFDYLVTNDSGPMHIAVSSGVPCVAIFGPTTQELGFFPYDEVSRVAEIQGLSCRPCGKHGHDKCKKGHFKCMKEITPEDVLGLFNIVSAPKIVKKPKYVTEKVD